MNSEVLKGLIIDSSNIIDFIESASMVVLAETLSTTNKRFVIITEHTNKYDAIDKMVEDFAECVLDIHGVINTLNVYLRKPHNRPRKELERQGLCISNKKNELMIISAENFVARKFLNEVKKYV